LIAKYQVKIGKIILSIITFKEVQKNFLSHIDIAKERPFIGLKRGAISIAQITTATELISNPKAAIIHDKIISIQYNLSHRASCFTFIATSAFFSGSNSKKSILLKKLLILSYNHCSVLFILSSIVVFSILFLFKVIIFFKY
jgi:hypothetical protein